jgi:D-glycero-alpha-D-manno-heptose-7-phosphate kinase
MAAVNGSGMIVTRTPLRISFAGGGTDLAEFYERDYGAVLSTAIDKYIYVTVKRHSNLFFEPIRLNYSKSEQVNRIDEIENDIARECLQMLDIEPPIYISTVGDMPASTGLGGSSSFAVGLLNALHAFKGERVAAGQLAEEACHIEIDVLGQPIGKQDQYAAAYGGINLFRFAPGGSVTVEPQRLKNGALGELFEHMQIFWTGHQRDASSVLTEQKANTGGKFEALLTMRQHAHALHRLMGGEHVDAGRFGQILDETWQFKRGLASSISNQQIDAWYECARAHGALGGKLCGAGGGGFLLFIVPPQRRGAVRAALSGLSEVPIGYEVHGSHVVHPFAA